MTGLARVPPDLQVLSFVMLPHAGNELLKTEEIARPDPERRQHHGLVGISFAECRTAESRRDEDWIDAGGASGIPSLKVARSLSGSRLTGWLKV